MTRRSHSRSSPDFRDLDAVHESAPTTHVTGQVIDIANARFTIGVGRQGERRLRRLAAAIFDSWEAKVSETVPMSDYALRFELAEGSLKGRAQIGTTLLALYGVIAGADGFVRNVLWVRDQALKAGEYLLHDARAQLDPDEQHEFRSRRDAGRIAQLHRVFVRVQNHELDASEATEEAERLFEGEDFPPNFSSDLRAAIDQLPRKPKQLELGLDSATFDGALVEEPSSTPSGRHRDVPIPPIPPPVRYRVEVWKDSKRDRRHILVRPL